jgi:hypothetical protein
MCIYESRSIKPLKIHDQHIFYQRNIYGHSPYVTSYLKRGWVIIYNCCCHSPAQSFSGPSPAGLMTIFYCLRFETPPTWRARFPYFYPPETRWPSFSPRHWVPFSSSPTTLRATMELFDHDSTRAYSFSWKRILVI